MPLTHITRRGSLTNVTCARPGGGRIDANNANNANNECAGRTARSSEMARPDLPSPGGPNPGPALRALRVMANAAADAPAE